MGIRLVSSLVVIISIFLLAFALNANVSSPESLPTLAKDFGKLPVRFEQNMGQYPADIQFISRSTQTSSLITKRGLIISNKNLAKKPIEIQFKGANTSLPISYLIQ